MESVREWIAGSRLGPAVASGSSFAGIEIVLAVVRGEGIVGVKVAVLSGLVFGAVMGVLLARTTRDLSLLSTSQRAQVMTAVRKGDAPQDPALVAAAVERAVRVQKQNSSVWPFVGLGIFVLLSVVIAIGDAIAGTLTTGDVLLVVFWLAFLPILWWQSRRVAERARSAEVAARRATGGPW